MMAVAAPAKTPGVERDIGAHIEALTVDTYHWFADDSDVAISAIGVFKLGNGQDGVANRLKCLRHQCRADGACRVSAAQRQHAATKFQGYRWRWK